MSTEAMTSLLLQQAMVANPLKYAAIIKALESPSIQNLRENLPAFKEQMDATQSILEEIERFKSAVLGTGYAQRRKNLKDDLFGELKASKMHGAGINIISIVHAHMAYSASVSRAIYEAAEMMAGANIISFGEAKSKLTNEVLEAEGALGKTRADAIMEKLANAEEDALKSLALEQQVNSGATTGFLAGLSKLTNILSSGELYFKEMHSFFEGYYNRLRYRHTEEGIDVQSFYLDPCPVFTDVTIDIWDNLDKAGEIENGSSKDELSIYTVNRAKAMIGASKNMYVWFGRMNEEFWKVSDEIYSVIENVRAIVIDVETTLGNSTWKYNGHRTDRLYADLSSAIKDMDMDGIPTVGRTSTSMNKGERFALKLRNDSIKSIAELLVSGASTDEITNRALELKAEERRFLLEENSFFNCQISQGNTFMGIAPGAIEVLPGEKPIGNLDNIWGSGFGDMKEFISGISEMKKWSNLFLATSPSFSNDKSNVLLVGPQGCGKTQLLRAVGADKSSISIFATGSDFLTCWLGEAQKNPKRLFEEAKRLQKLSGGKDVNILIDEIDEVLSKDSQGVSNKVNLSGEFQNLMDGVVAYPGIRVWGATNHPERIPTPMLRRFARVEIVGEMDQNDREETLRYYIENFLPVGETMKDNYSDWSLQLSGATGDILRKVADEVWRRVIGTLIRTHEDVAKLVVDYIKSEYGENFEISELTDESRVVIKGFISEVIVVSPFVVQSIINEMLNNFAVKEQIAEACNTYTIAKAMKNKDI